MRKRAGATDAHVGQRIRLRRTLLGISQTRLGEAVGLTFQQVQKYERGINQLSASRLYQFSSVLQVPVGYFFDGIQNNGSGQKDDTDAPLQLLIQKHITRRETLELVKAYYAIVDDGVRKHILDLAIRIGDSQADNQPVIE